MKQQNKIDICNQACSLVGLDPLVNLNTDKSIRATQCRELLPSVLKTTLETLNYEFSRKTMPLIKKGDGYQQPPDFISLIGLTPYKATSGLNTVIDRDVKFKFLDDIMYILTPVGFLGAIDDRLLVFTSLNEDNTDPSSTLKDAMAHHLAYYLAARMGSFDDPGKFYQMYLMLIEKSKEVNLRTHNLNVEVEDYNSIPFYGTGKGRLR